MATETGSTYEGVAGEQLPIDPWLQAQQREFDLKAWEDNVYLSEPPKHISFGIKNLDAQLSQGLHTGVNVIMAEPGCGKSALGCHLAYNAAKNGAKAMILSLEMPVPQTFVRIASEHAAITDGLEPFQWGEMDQWRRQTYAAIKAECMTVTEAKSGSDPVLTALGHLQYSVPNLIVTDCQGETDVVKVCSKIVEMTAYGCDLVVVDYLQRITTQASNRYEMITQATHALTNTLRDIGVVGVVISSMGRNARRAGETLAGADGTGAIEYDAESIWRIYRDLDAPATGDPNRVDLDVEIAKNRNGIMTSKEPIRIKWWPAYNMFR